jgi:hypothetical protein
MTWLIGQIAMRTGLGSLLASVSAYALIALIAGGGIWAWSAHRYNVGYDAGQSHERQAWEEQRKRDRAKQAAKVASDQAKIDQIEAENAALEQTLDQRRAQAALDAAVAKEAAENKPAIPKSIAKALNGIR